MNISHIRTYVSTHRVVATILALVVLYGGYYTYQRLTAPSTAMRYITTKVATSTVIATMSETGQVSASSNVTIDSQSSGEVLSVPVAVGQYVTAGTALAYLDPTTAEESVVSARQALESAQIALAQLQEPAATSTLISAQNAVATAQASLVNDHQNGYNDISAAFLDMPGIVTGLNTILHGTVVPGRTSEQNENAYSDMTQPYNGTVVQYRLSAESAYQTAYAAYTVALADFTSTPRNASDATIEALITETYQAASDLSNALKSSTTFLNFVDTTLTNNNLSPPLPLVGQINTLAGYTATINGNVTTLSADAANVTSDENTLTAMQASLAQLQAGADPLNIQSAQLSVQEKQDALAQAELALADTVVRAPFSGTVATLNVQQYETVGNNANIATMVSDNQNVDISVNEVDVAKLALGQKATLTFGALPTVSIGGTVSSIDAIGTVSQGVVSYNAVITFDTPNPNVKTGMSATADIITNVATGLTVPNSAVKTIGTQSYVDVFNPPLPLKSENSLGMTSSQPPVHIPVTTGLANDTNVIITSGLSKGEQVVTQTIAGTLSTAPTSAAQSTSLFGGGVGGGAAAHAVFKATHG